MTTTIKVDVSVRDRLACVARARGTTMGALLDDESRRLAREQQWTEIDAAYDRLRNGDPEGWREYVDELDTWNAGTASRDAEATAEWPEYNG